MILAVNQNRFCLILRLWLIESTILGLLFDRPVLVVAHQKFRQALCVG